MMYKSVTHSLRFFDTWNERKTFPLSLIFFPLCTMRMKCWINHIFGKRESNAITIKRAKNRNHHYWSILKIQILFCFRYFTNIVKWNFILAKNKFESKHWNENTFRMRFKWKRWKWESWFAVYTLPPNMDADCLTARQL